jgi:hypothetical protein
VFFPVVVVDSEILYLYNDNSPNSITCMPPCDKIRDDGKTNGIVTLSIRISEIFIGSLAIKCN